VNETHTHRHTRSWLRRALRVAALVGAVVSLAAPAFAARIVQVRIGNHPTFSRVVFELDSHTGYQIESRDLTDDKVLAILIDADSRNRDVISKSLGVGSVTVEAVDGGSLVRVKLRRDDLTVKEMILSNPPRIVLDFQYPTHASEVASTSSAHAPTDHAPSPAEPATPVQVESEPIEPEWEVVTSTAISEPKPVAVAEPEPVAVAEPEPVAVAVPEPLAIAEREPVAVAEPEPVAIAESEPVAVAPTDASDESGDAMEGTEFAADTAADAPALDSAISDSMPDPQTEEFNAQDEPVAQLTPEVAPPTSQSAPVEQPRRIAESRAPEPSETNTTLFVAIAAGVLLVAGVVLIARRRGSIPNDLDLSALPDEPGSDYGPGTEKRAESEPTEFIRPSEEGSNQSPSQSSDATAVMAVVDESRAQGSPFDGAGDGADATMQVSEANTAAYSLSEVSTNSAPANTGLFDEDSEGEKQMDMEANDLPAELGALVTSTSPGSGDSANSDLSSMVQEMMTRLGTLETRLEESNEARERLESQVAAQSEELRVQRAAIARTQRALRSLSRTDEDQATEPALRNPSS
jgi:hypothetical protein